MTREEMADQLLGLIAEKRCVLREWDDGGDERLLHSKHRIEREVEALEVALPLLFLHELNEDGLPNCGCGRPLVLRGDDETQYWVECSDTYRCPHYIGEAYDGCGVFFAPEQAIAAAKKAMGVRETN